jgi:hypothetical protein
MGVHVPEVACTLLLQEEKFKFYFAQLSHLVSLQHTWSSSAHVWHTSTPGETCLPVCANCCLLWCAGA